jgi:uncharacterized membrane protein
MPPPIPSPSISALTRVCNALCGGGLGWGLAAILLAFASMAAMPIPGATAGEASDADVLAITEKHCVMCHARNPSHPSFNAPPKGVALETVDDLKVWAVKMREQVVELRNMPIGNETGMTEGEREMLARWVEGLK